MAYNTIHNLNNVYNFYMTTYAPKSSTPYDTHKKSELRSVYNSIVKMNKESPLFILDTSKESREFAVGIKENARELRNTIASLGGLDEEELLNKKVAYSSNEEIATAKYIGSKKPDDDFPSYEVEDIAGKWDISTNGIKNPYALQEYLETRLIRNDKYTFLA